MSRSHAPGTRDRAAPEPLPPEVATRLADLARSLKAAARAVGLYPPTHPAIRAATDRLLQAAREGGALAITVLPDTLLVDGRAVARPELAITEMAALLHEHLVGELRVDPQAAATEWQTLLQLLARSVEDIRAAGGIARALTTAGAHHLQVREIDYAEVLRERAGGGGASWAAIVDNCLDGAEFDLDERTLSAILEAAGDAAQFSAMLDELQARARSAGQGISAQAAALLRMLRGLATLADAEAQGGDRLLDHVADATARLSPELMLALVSQARHAGAGPAADVAARIVGRISDAAVARFVAQAVATEHGATERLAQAFQALVPEPPRRDAVLEAARTAVGQTPLGQDPAFDDTWAATTRTLLTTYSDARYVSDAYARELSEARTQAVDVERVSDDPPERIGAWLATIAEASVQQLDQALLLDLLRIETAPDRWRDVADIVAAHVEQLTLGGAFGRATTFVEAIAREAGPDGHDQRRGPAGALLDRLAAGPLMRHVVLYLRKAEDADVAAIAHVCHLLGTATVRPLAEALAAEEGGRSLRRLRELLIGFGASGRQAVEQLKQSPNPAVRRTAVDLLRAFGGREALPDLAALLEDSELQVQREAIRAIIQIGTEEAFQVLERALSSRTSRSRDMILQSVGSLRDERAAALFCYVLRHTDYRGSLQPVHLAIIEALGGVSDAGRDAMDALREVLHRGQWWAPGRTATFRRAAAIALRRIGTPAAVAVLEEAAAGGSRRVRAHARAELALVRPTRERAS